LIASDDSHALLAHPDELNWHVGHSFLRFNVINHSWVFGLKMPDKKGFNFKVDMLNQADRYIKPQQLRAGMVFMTTQTDTLSGHIQMGADAPEQFVTAKHAWFRQIWLTSLQTSSHLFKSTLCQLYDGRAFHAMTMMEPDVVRGAVSGWFDADGAPVSISQFIAVTEDKKGLWRINIPSLNMIIPVSEGVALGHVFGGFASGNNQQGFCMLSDAQLG
jgi:hypothetical protein